jgi:hypothetical protein
MLIITELISLKNKLIVLVNRKKFDFITPKCFLVHYGFHYILNEFGLFTMVKLVNPLMNGCRLLRIMNWSTST